MDAGTRINGWLTLKLPIYCIGMKYKNLVAITSQDQTCQQQKKINFAAVPMVLVAGTMHGM